MKAALALVLLVLSGCASQRYAGVAGGEVEPVAVGDKLIGYRVTVYNGKEINSLHARLVKTADSFTLELDENGVTAFKGQEISAAAAKSAATTTAKAAAALIVGPAVLPAAAAAIGVLK